jgi:hypothetical protein
LEAREDWITHAAFIDTLAADGFVALGGPVEGPHKVLLIIRANAIALRRTGMALAEGGHEGAARGGIQRVWGDTDLR